LKLEKENKIKAINGRCKTQFELLDLDSQELFFNG